MDCSKDQNPIGSEPLLQLQGLIRHMVDASGLTYAQVSRAIGRNDRYLSVMLSEGTTPRMDLLIRIADACGYTLELRDARDFEAWELQSDNGNVLAQRLFSEQDVAESEQARADALTYFEDRARAELIDSLIEYLQGLKEQPASD